MKVIFSLLLVLFSSLIVSAQATVSDVDVVTLYSQNEKFYLKSIPFDKKIPSLRGKTFVYKTGSNTPLYILERGFDVMSDDDGNLILSNDGEVIFYAVTWSADEEKEGLKSVNIYRRGKIIKSFTETEITGCDEKKERCGLIYVDNDNEPVSAKDKFLDAFPIFSFDNIVYLTDSKKITHLFDLNTGEIVGKKPFDEIYGQIETKGRLNKINLQRFDSPTFLDFPNLKNGKNTPQSLAEFIGMKAVNSMDEKDEQFKWYSFKINLYILQDGSIEIEDAEFYDELPKEKILEFFKTNKFDSSSVPKITEKWFIGEEYFYFRKADEKLARKEKEDELIQQNEEFKKRLVAEKIDDVYIPKDLGECFTELDRLLKEVDRKEMQTLPKQEDMIKYHHGLGTWIRNNWGLWGGSRLQKYFTDRGINHPDEMSGIILEFYHDWLNGRRETWKTWEKNPKQ